MLTGAKSFEQNPIIGSRWLNERGLHAARVRFAHRSAQARRRRLASSVAADDLLTFERDGVVVRRNFLPEQSFNILREEIRATPLALKERFEGSSLLRKAAVTLHLRRCLPALAELLDMQDWGALIRLVGARDAAPDVHLQAVLQQAAPGARDPQSFLHADTFHPTVKAWFYLTDVEEESGPLQYVRGSNRLSKARLAWEHEKSLFARDADDRDTRQGSFRIAERELLAMGLPPPTSHAVPANTLIVADTFGFHARGIATRPSLRVEIWAFGRRNPFLPWKLLDRLTNAAGRERVAWRRRTGSLFDPAEASGLPNGPGVS